MRRDMMDRGGALQHCPTRRLSARVFDAPCARIGETRLSGDGTGSAGQPPVEIMAFEADQRLVASADLRRKPTAALHRDDRRERGRQDVQPPGLFLDCITKRRFQCRHSHRTILLQ